MRLRTPRLALLIEHVRECAPAEKLGKWQMRNFGAKPGCRAAGSDQESRMAHLHKNAWLWSYST